MSETYYGSEIMKDDYSGHYFVNDKDNLKYMRAYLCKDLGITDSRCGDFAEALYMLHKALARCSFHNADKFCKEFNGMATACGKFGELEGLADKFYTYNGEELK